MCSPLENQLSGLSALLTSVSRSWQQPGGSCQLSSLSALLTSGSRSWPYCKCRAAGSLFIAAQLCIPGPIEQLSPLSPVSTTDLST